MGKTSIADTLYSRLHNHGGNIEKSLSTFKAKLDSKCVSKVLHRFCPKQSHLGIRFFIWAGLQSRYRHSAYMYMKACDLFGINQNPQVIFDVIESYEVERSLVTANMLKEVLKLCEKAELVDVALWLLTKLAEFNLRADIIMYNVVIKLCCKNSDMEMAEKLMREMSSNDLYPDMVTYMTMIEGFCNVGCLEDAYSVLKAMRLQGCPPNSVVFSAILYGLCRSRPIEKALQLLGEMEKEGGKCSPNVVTYTSMIQTFFKNGQWTEALHILDRMKAFGCFANRVTVSPLIEGLCAQGQVEDANKLIDKFVGKHSVSYGDCYNSLVIALIRIKKLEETEKFFREMLACAIEPDSLACSLLLKELCINERMPDGFCLLNDIENTGCSSSIDSDIYSILLLGLYRQSQLMEVTKLARIMLNKSVVLRASDCDSSAIDILRNSGEKDLVDWLTGIRKGH